ncbi:signal peptidase I [Aureimonas jatrophae]|jgi:signal peptidase I|uniref:Signal peptidase I n=1 Tax=Aureimonas jatrophae TaxID=1166073 RepID=A0A1H0CW95_9HYPH|nr:signal peptidase I [Aureimonas jatrophae]MBB3949387.1 signal peptidase I [Aureimonas jatrophae]SDN62148.1 signal peptidase I Serine peptidase. MEROPS family S26A [Aureimonas jatrophae]
MADRAIAKEKGGFGETVKVIVQALLLALVIRTVLFQPFSIPSGSMMPTLLIGDYLFVSKWSYGFSKYSIPFSPDLFEGRILASAPERGDVVVFRKPNETDTDYIKRLVGLPGDRIQMRDGVLFINGQAVPKEPAGTFTTETGVPVPQFRETLPNGVTYITLDAETNSVGDNTREFVVPEGHYFMMGDNRDNSLDSRFDVGYVPFENFVGKAQVIFFSMENDASPLEIWRWPTDLRPSRILTWLG